MYSVWHDAVFLLTDAENIIVAKSAILTPIGVFVVQLFFVPKHWKRIFTRDGISRPWFTKSVRKLITGNLDGVQLDSRELLIDEIDATIDSRTEHGIKDIPSWSDSS
jgi:hypothetical protein